jgi:uncharacterized protein (TIGR00369 family)
LEKKMTERSPKLSPDAAALFETRSIGELGERMGIELLELSAERAVATMPVEGNRQPLGLLHGGAYVVLAESLGSMSANVWGHHLNKFAVGIEVSASHSGSARSGLVTATCESVSLGNTLTVHQISVVDSDGKKLSTVRITNLLRDRR